jgi:hypothetical protein
MKTTVTLRDAISDAAQGAYMDAHNKGPDHARAMADARKYWEGRALRVDISTGTVRDCDGTVAQIVNYDGPQQYEAAPNFIYWDFFAPILTNSAGKIKQGLAP